MSRKRKRDVPATLQEALAFAAQIACKFKVLECKECAIAIAKQLGRDFDACFERLRTADETDVLGLLEGGIQASVNQTHLGVRIGDLIIDNPHPDGVPANQWAGRYVACSGAAFVQQSQPIRAFFGRGFLVKEFNDWAFRPANQGESYHEQRS